MIHGGGILIGGEDRASVIMADIIDLGMGTMVVTMGDIIGGAIEDTLVAIMVEGAMAVDIMEVVIAVDIVVGKAMAVDIGDSWV